jgi:hypothetical protein
MNAPERKPPWECPYCKAQNFGSHPQCLSCGTPRQADEPLPQQAEPAPLPAPPRTAASQEFPSQGSPEKHPLVFPQDLTPIYPIQQNPAQQASSIQSHRAPVPKGNKKNKLTWSCLILAGVAGVFICASAVVAYFFHQPLLDLLEAQNIQIDLGSKAQETSQPAPVIEVPAQGLSHNIVIPNGWIPVDLNEVGVRLYLPPGTEVNLYEDIDYGNLLIPASSIFIDGREIHILSPNLIDIVWEPVTSNKTLADISQDWLAFQSGYVWQEPNLAKSMVGTYAWSNGVATDGKDLNGWTAIYFPLLKHSTLRLFSTFSKKETQDTLIFLQMIGDSGQPIPK